MKTAHLFFKPNSDATTALPPADMETLVATLASAKANTVIKGSGKPFQDGAAAPVIEDAQTGE